MFITTYSGIGALTRAEIGVVLKIPYLKQIMVDTANEILKIAQAKKINLTQKDADNAIRVIDHLSPETTASMQRDVMEGKPSELDNFNGYIVRQGKALGIETPMNTFIYNCLLPQEIIARNSL